MKNQICYFMYGLLFDTEKSNFIITKNVIMKVIGREFWRYGRECGWLPATRFWEDWALKDAGEGLISRHALLDVLRIHPP